MVVGKSEDGLSFTVWIGHIERMTREERNKKLNSSPPRMLEEGEYVSVMYTPDKKDVITLEKGFLRVSERLTITSGKVLLEKSTATADRSGSINYSRDYRVIYEAEFPEFTAERLKSVEVGTPIKSVKTLEKLRRFICAEGEFAHLAK